MAIINLTQLAVEIHAANKEKGFWDAERNVGELMMLVITELSEALEAHRKGKFANVAVFKDRLDLHPEGFIDFFQCHIKDTYEDEIADTVIRILDYVGFLNIEIELSIDYKAYSYDFNIGEFMLEITDKLYNVYYFKTNTDSLNYENNIYYAITRLFLLAYKNDIDLMFHVEQKLKYNKTRPRLHGKSY